MQWERISIAVPSARASWQGYPPADGNLSQAYCLRLAELLANGAVESAGCEFGFWTGYGFIPRDIPAARITIGPLAFVLFKGMLDKVSRLRVGGHGFQSPNVWWPDDRSWFVATHIDLNSTYVGASSERVRGLLGAADLEVAETRLDARVDARSDTIN